MTRSKAKKRKNKASTSNSASNPIFQQTPLQELYLGESHFSEDQTDVLAEIMQNMIWEQLEFRNTKVLSAFREIIRDGDPSDDDDDDDAEGASWMDEYEDSEEEDLLDGEDGQELLEDEEDPEEQDLLDEAERELHMEDEDSASAENEEGAEQEVELDHTRLRHSEPYFAKLRDGTSPQEVAMEEEEGDNVADGDENEDEDNDEDSFGSVRPSRNGMGVGKHSAPVTVNGSTPLDSGFFSLSDFHSQMREGEDEMRLYMRSGKSKSAADLQDRLDALGSLNETGADEDENDENQEIDYFAPVRGESASDVSDKSDEGDDKDEEETRIEDMRYADFWKPPKLLYGDNSAITKKGKETGVGGKSGEKSSKAKKYGKNSQHAISGSHKISPPPGAEADKNKRRVSFHGEVKVQEIEPNAAGKSKVAALVKRVGMANALKRLSNGQLEDTDMEGIDGMEEEEEDDDDDDVEDNDGDGEGNDDEIFRAAHDSADEDGADDAESNASDEDGNSDMRTMRRIHSDLLADDIGVGKSSNKGDAQSRYEQRMATLSEQIASLEQENVAEREWAMRGETNARARPLNSLLEEDLEFDQISKVVPVVTEESSLSLEEKIKKRILDVGDISMQA